MAAGQVADADGHFCALTGAQGRQRQPRRNGECWSTALGASCCSGGSLWSTEGRAGLCCTCLGSGSVRWHQDPMRTRHTHLYVCVHVYAHAHPRMHIDAHCCYNFHLFNPVARQKLTLHRQLWEHTAVTGRSESHRLSLPGAPSHLLLFLWSLSCGGSDGLLHLVAPLCSRHTGDVGWVLDVVNPLRYPEHRSHCSPSCFL